MELFQGNGQLDEDVEDILYELGNVGVAAVQYFLQQAVRLYPVFLLP